MTYVNAFFASVTPAQITKLFSAPAPTSTQGQSKSASGPALLPSPTALKNTTADAIAAIQALVKGGAQSAAVGGAQGANADGLTADQTDSLQRIRAWIKSGAVDDAASGKDSSWLQEMAKDGKLGTMMATWTPEFDKQMSLPEKRVWAEARMWQAMYEGQPKNLAEAAKQWTSDQLAELPQFIEQEQTDASSGRLDAEQVEMGKAGLNIRINELKAIQEGRVSFELADPKLNFKVETTFMRDASGIVIGGSSSESLDQSAYRNIYGLNTENNPRWHDLGYSPHFGGFVISWDK